MAGKPIPVTEAAQRVVDAVKEVVSYELQGEYIRFNFDKPRRVYPASVITSSATIFVGEDNTVEDGSEKLVIKQLRRMLNYR